MSDVSHYHFTVCGIFTIVSDAHVSAMTAVFEYVSKKWTISFYSLTLFTNTASTSAYLKSNLPLPLFRLIDQLQCTITLRSSNAPRPSPDRTQDLVA